MDDPWVMYLVVRKDVPLGRGQAMALAGAGAVACVDGLGARFAAPFREWDVRPRKVALRASVEALASLRPYTDPPRAARPPEPPSGPLLRYVLPRGVLRTTGKAMAQAGHAALECAQTLGTAHEGAFAAWRSAGRPGEVRLADAGAWDAVRAHAAAGAGVVVSDAGLTQVAPGTETVAAFPPSPAAPTLLDALPVLP